MNIAVIGAGKVGRALGRRWEQIGHRVTFGVRNPDDPRHGDLLRASGVEAAIEGAEVCLISLPWTAVEEVVTHLDFGDAIVIDATNPLAAGARELEADPALSGAELVRRWARTDRVVKAFNTTGSANMEDTTYPAAKPMMTVASDDERAKAIAIRLASEIGFEGLDAGPLAAARDLEHLAMLWIRLAYPLGNGPGIAFSLLRR